MADEQQNVVSDVLGIRPVGEAFNAVTKSAVGGAEAFFGRICLPAAEEVGLWFRDVVHHYRTQNVASLAARAEAMTPEGVHAHPRVVHSIVEAASWNEDPAVQDLWG